MPNIQYISFDIWNTLITSNPLFKETQIEIFSHFLGINDIEKLAQVIKQVDVWADNYTNQTGQDLDFEFRITQIAQILATYLPNTNTIYKAMEDAFLANPPLLIEPDLIETLTRWYPHKKMFLLSNTGFVKGETMRKYLHKTGILSLIQNAIFSNEVGFAKPHRTIFEALINQCQTKQIYHIGDNYQADYEGAKNMGLIPILFENQKNNVIFAATIAKTPNLKSLLYRL